VAAGPQSRRRARAARLGGCLAPAMALGALAFALPFGLVAVLLAAAPGSLGVAGPLVAVLTAAAGVAAFAGVGWALWRRTHPRRTGALSVEPALRHVRRGDRIGVRVAGEVPAEVGLVCRCHWDRWPENAGAGSPDVAESDVWQRWWPAPASGGPVEVQLPGDGPYSHEGRCVSFAWLVVARPAGDERAPRSAAAAVWVEP